jgi:hypothetical protein
MTAAVSGWRCHYHDTLEIPDFLSMPPAGVDTTVEVELATLRAIPHDVALRQLRASASAQRDGRVRPLPVVLTRPGFPTAWPPLSLTTGTR